MSKCAKWVWPVDGKSLNRPLFLSLPWSFVTPFLLLPPLNLLLFICCNRSAPSFSTLLFLITNSPGVSIAGTVSRLPLPGTIPPLLNLLNPPPPPAPPAALRPIPANLPTPGAKALPIFNPNIVINKGSSGSTASITFIMALAIFSAPVAILLNGPLSVNLRINAVNSSLTFTISLPNPCCAVAASFAVDPLAFWATLRACCAVANC